MGSEQVASRHYVFLMFLTLLNVMNFVDRQLLGSFANFIVPDLGLTNTQFGLLTGLFFIVFYSAMGLFMGALADTVNRTRFIAIGLGLWSVLTALSLLIVGYLAGRRHRKADVCPDIEDAGDCAAQLPGARLYHRRWGSAALYPWGGGL